MNEGSKIYNPEGRIESLKKALDTVILMYGELREKHEHINARRNELMSKYEELREARRADKKEINRLERLLRSLY